MDDELGRLYAEFNAMVAEMTALRSKVEAQGFMEGGCESGELAAKAILLQRGVAVRQD